MGLYDRLLNAFESFKKSLFVLAPIDETGKESIPSSFRAAYKSRDISQLVLYSNKLEGSILKEKLMPVYARLASKRLFTELPIDKAAIAYARLLEGINGSVELLVNELFDNTDNKIDKKYMVLTGSDVYALSAMVPDYIIRLFENGDWNIAYSLWEKFEKAKRRYARPDRRITQRIARAAVRNTGYKGLFSNHPEVLATDILEIVSSVDGKNLSDLKNIDSEVIAAALSVQSLDKVVDAMKYVNTVNIGMLTNEMSELLSFFYLMGRNERNGCFTYLEKENGREFFNKHCPDSPFFGDLYVSYYSTEKLPRDSKSFPPIRIINNQSQESCVIDPLMIDALRSCSMYISVGDDPNKELKDVVNFLKDESFGVV